METPPPRNDDHTAKQALQWKPRGHGRRQRPTEYLEKRSGVRNGSSGIQVQLEEDEGGGSRQNWMKKSGLWLVLHLEQQVLSQESQEIKYSVLTIGKISTLRGQKDINRLMYTMII